MSTDHGPIIQKSIKEISQYLKVLVPTGLEKDFSLNQKYKELTSDEQARQGLLAYRDFLNLFFDQLADQGDHFFKLKKKPNHEADYPFLYVLSDLLSDIGYFGEFSKDKKSILMTEMPSFIASVDARGHKIKAKNSKANLMRCLNFLSLCGFVYKGIDLDNKALDISKDHMLEITYPSDPKIFLGLKLLAIGDIEDREKRYKNDFNHDNLLRWDYRLIGHKSPDPFTLLEDALNSIPTSVKAFVLKMHRHCIEKGLTCLPKLSTFDYQFAYAYTKKSKKELSPKAIYQKRLWTLSISPRHGFSLVLRPKRTQKYPGLIDEMPLLIQEKIEIGYGCDRKLRNQPCQGGCQGHRFPLDASLLEIDHSLERWIEEEVLLEIM